METPATRTRLAFFLLGYVPLVWFDAWNVFADARSGTALATLILLLAGSVLGLILLKLKPLHFLLPAKNRQTTGAAFALGLTISLGAQLPTWLPYAEMSGGARRLLEVPLLLVLLLAVVYPILGRLLGGIAMPRKAIGVLVALVVLNMGWFQWQEMKLQKELTTTIRQPLGTQESEAKPNVILLVFDTMRGDTLHETWRDQKHTPWLDEYTKDARIFSRGYAGANTTPGGHAALLTGRYPAENGTLPKGEVVLPQSETSVAEFLRGYGYRTAGTVTNARITRATGFAQGFEVYDDSLVLNDSVLFAGINRFSASSFVRLCGGKKAKRAVSAIAKRTLRTNQLELTAADTTRQVLATVDALDRQPEEPVFLFVNYIDPHFPYVTREDLALKFGPNVANERMEAIKNSSHMMHDLLRNDANEVRHGRISKEIQENFDWLQEAYREQYLELDEGVKELFEGLEERGVMNDNTIVLITSDHGEHLGAHGIMMHGRSLYEDEVHVPFLLMGPRVEPGRVEEPVAGVDFFATVLRSMGLQVEDSPNQMGVPLQDEIPVRVVRFESGIQRGFVVGHHKMVAEDNGTELTWVQAFDLKADPGELTNLVDSGADWVEAFKANPPIVPNSSATTVASSSGMVDLAALGYVDEG
ncbi:MAG: sulfatase [Planctomycetota bacterium]